MDTIETAVHNALHMAMSRGSGNPVLPPAPRFIAELGEQGYAIVKAPLMPVTEHVSNDTVVETLTNIDYWGARSRGSARTTARRMVEVMRAQGWLR